MDILYVDVEGVEACNGCEGSRIMRMWETVSAARKEAQENHLFEELMLQGEVQERIQTLEN